MFTATFTFAKRQFDDAFHALDQVIAATAKSLPGYLGEASPATGDGQIDLPLAQAVSPAPAAQA